MKKLLLLALVMVSFIGHAQITVDETLTTQQLVQDILINGTCAQTSNFMQSTGTDFGDDNGIGAFDANGSDFPFASGVILTSGNVANAPGPNLTVHSDGGGGWPGDADLEAFTTATNTNNASWIQFDFVPFVSTINFDFIMASEEYNQNFECTFSDAFAFILTDNVTGVTQNLAVLPGTTIPIEVTNIREEVPGQCDAVNPEFFDKYNFDPFNPAVDAAIDFNGQTVELTATGPVIAGNPYTIKLVIADETDTAFDIAVFLEAGSFNIGNVDLGIDLTIAGGNARCAGVDYEIVPDLTVPSGTTFEWQFEDPLGSGIFVPFVPAETGPTLIVSNTGNYKLIADFAGVCTSEGEVFIEFDTPFPINPTPDPLIKCDSDNDGFTEFDLSMADADITLANPDLVVSYHGTLLDAQNDALPLPMLYTNDDIYNDSVWARVTSMTNSCVETVELFLEVRDSPVATTPAEPLRLCDDIVADGFTFFDLTVVEPEVYGTMDPTEFDIYYYVLEADAIAAGDVALTAPDFSLAIPTPTNFLNSSNPQTIYILVVGNTTSTSPPNPNGAEGCYDIVELELIVDPLPLDLGPFEMFLCDDELNGSTPTDQISTFDLTSQNDALTGGDMSLTVTWFASAADEAADIPIPDPTMYQNIATPQTVIGRITTEFDCSITSTLTLTVLPNPTPTVPTALEECDDDDDGFVSTFDLTTKDAEIINGETDVSVLYYETLPQAEAGVAGTEIVGLYTNIVANSQIVYARVTRDVPPGILPCFTIVELELVVVALPPMPDTSLGFMDPLLSCDDDGDGQAVFDLTSQDVGVLAGLPATDFVDPILYFESEADAIAGAPSIAPSNAFVSGGQTIWVRLESLATGCARITPFEIVVGEFPVLGTPNDLFLCDDEVNGSTSTDGLSTFDLTLNTDVINQGDASITVVYYGSAADQAADIPVADATAYQNIASPQQEIFVTATNLEGCPAQTSFFINVDANPNAAVPTPLVVCDDDNDGFYSFFDLTVKDAEIANGETDVDVLYFENEPLAVIGDAASALPNPYTNIVPFNQTVFARVTRNVIGSLPCFTIVPLELVVEELPDEPTADFINPMELCDDDGDGFVEFNLELNNDPVLGTQEPVTDFTISYYESEADANVPQNPIPNPDMYTNITTPTQTVWVRLENITTGCARITPFDLQVNDLPVIGVGPFEMLLCDDEQNGSSATDGISTFDLTSNNEDITLGDATLAVFYYETTDDQTNNIPIADPTAYQNLLANPQTVYVTVFTDDAVPCSADTTVTLRVLSNPTPNTTPEDLEVCDDTDRDGIAEFVLTDADLDIIGGEPDVNVLYYETIEQAMEGVAGTELLSPYENIIPNEQVVYARVTKDVPPAELACYTIVELTLRVNQLPDDSAQISDEIDCQIPFVGEASIILDDKNVEVLNGQDPNDFTVMYFETQADATAMTGAIASGAPYVYDTTERTIYVGILNNESTCYVAYIEGENALSFLLAVKEGATATEPLLPYTICDNYEENDGIGQFTLIVDPDNPTELDAQAQALSDEILNGQDPIQFELTFHETLELAEEGIDPLSNVYINIINPQVIYARVTNLIDPADENACYQIVPVTLEVNQLPIVILEEEYRLCVDANGNPIEQEEGATSPPLIDTGLDPSLYSFVWSLDGEVLPNEVGPSITALAGGVYEVQITQLETGCVNMVATTVVLSSPPLTFDAQVVSGAFDATHVIEATAEGLGEYIFQLDDGAFQSEGTFTGVEPGNHIVTIKDANGCGSVTIELGVIDYPRIVTPNQDGFHDTWNIIGIANGDPTAKIYIFDKFGKLLKQISPLGAGWDGTYNGNPLPSSDYWFRVEYKENDTQ
ncbi:MAG: choice-of-anchor L domain-containing protein, partial [Bacteroidota bacterium]